MESLGLIEDKEGVVSRRGRSLIWLIGHGQGRKDAFGSSYLGGVGLEWLLTRHGSGRSRESFGDEEVGSGVGLGQDYSSGRLEGAKSGGGEEGLLTGLRDDGRGGFEQVEEHAREPEKETRKDGFGVNDEGWSGGGDGGEEEG